MPGIAHKGNRPSGSRVATASSGRVVSNRATAIERIRFISGAMMG